MTTPVPHDPETEKALLSCLLLAGARGNQAILDDAVVLFQENPFFTSAHRLIWRAIKDLHANGQPIEPPSVMQKLSEEQTMQQIGGQQYLTDVYSSEVSPRNWEHYAKKAVDLLNARRTIDIAADLARAALDPSAAQRLPILLNEVMAKISGFHESKVETKPIKDILLRRMKHWESTMNGTGKMDGITTGIPPLDRAIRGMRPGNMIVISAPTKGGKSALAMNILCNTAKAGNPAAIFSMEMNEDEIADRIIAAEAEIDISSMAFAGPNKYTIQRITKSINTIGKCKIFVRDESVMNTLQFRASARKLVAQEGCKLLIVDYVQLMEPTDPATSRERQVAESSRAIKTTAQELAIPIIVLCQLNDNGRSRESRAIEQDANIFIKIERPQDSSGVEDKEAPPDHYNVRIVLARDCATATIPMVFNKEFTKFLPREYGA